MIDRLHDPQSTSRTTAALALLVLGAGLCAGLGGCANVGDSFASSAFVDPAKYEQFDCKQLEGERKALAMRTAELQGLIAKAETGVGGSVVGELAYRNDYISARASGQTRRRDLAAEQMRRQFARRGDAGASSRGAGARQGPWLSPIGQRHLLMPSSSSARSI